MDFYESFAKIVATQGFARNDSQTQREFAAAVQTAIAARLQPYGLARLPAELSEAFYRVKIQLEFPQLRPEHDRLDQPVGATQGVPGFARARRPSSLRGVSEQAFGKRVTLRRPTATR